MSKTGSSIGLTVYGSSWGPITSGAIIITQRLGQRVLVEFAQGSRYWRMTPAPDDYRARSFTPSRPTMSVTGLPLTPGDRYGVVYFDEDEVVLQRVDDSWTTAQLLMANALLGRWDKSPVDLPEYCAYRLSQDPLLTPQQLLNAYKHQLGSKAKHYPKSDLLADAQAAYAARPQRLQLDWTVYPSNAGGRSLASAAVRKGRIHLSAPSRRALGRPARVELNLEGYQSFTVRPVVEGGYSLRPASGAKDPSTASGSIGLRGIDELLRPGVYRPKTLGKYEGRFEWVAV